ncbi:unnamed protein product [Ambrosiozyma monospora]|uniref:Unnamed protein product n=1 Tax=Ambrosiozyma monospora TaxID=43982 RepID=A0ACB5TA16_AMBMO|nr:unnamed protein product [Ambrosiozyma monospora]
MIIQTPADNLSIFNINSALRLLRLNRRQDLSLKIIKSKLAATNNLQPDIQTYTEIFANLRGQDRYEEAIKLAEHYFLRLQRSSRINIDPILIGNYSSLFVFSNDPNLMARGILILRQYYRLCPKDQMNTKDINLQKFHEAAPTNKKLKQMLKGKRKLNEGTDAKDVLLNEDQVNIRKLKRFEPEEQILKRYDHLCHVLQIKNTYNPEKRVRKDQAFSKNEKEKSKKDKVYKQAFAIRNAQLDA